MHFNTRDLPTEVPGTKNENGEYLKVRVQRLESGELQVEFDLLGECFGEFESDEFLVEFNPVGELKREVRLRGELKGGV